MEEAKEEEQESYDGVVMMMMVEMMMDAIRNSLGRLVFFSGCTI